MDNHLLHFYFYVPVSHSEIVKAAVFNAGAGKFNHYEMCCFETKGIGQFLPLENAKPSLGSLGEVARVEEVKVEMIVREIDAKNVKNALLTHHPYEEVAYGFIRLSNI